MSERLSHRAVAFTKSLLAPILLIIASIAFVAANAPAHQAMSPFDEYVYIDYLDKIDDQGLVRHGEMTGDLARSYYSCVGVEVFGKIAPENCGTDNFGIDSQYPLGGINSADIYTPLYFAVTWVVAQPIMWATGVDLVGAGRLAGSLWLASAAVVLYFALGRLGLSLTSRFSGSLLLVASTAAWWANTYVSTDASALLVGATLLLLGLRYSQSGKGGWHLVLASILAVALKLQNFMGVVVIVGLLALLLLGQYRHQKKPPPGPVAKRISQLPRKATIITLAGMLVLPILFQFGWLMLRSILSVGPPGDQQVAQPLGLAELVREALKFYGRVGLGGTVPIDATVGWALATLISWLITAGVIAAIAIEPRWSERYSLALGWLVTAMLAGPALAIATRVTSGYYFDLPLRYGLSLFPVALALATMLVDRKIETRFAFAGLAGVTFVASLTPYFPGAMWG